MPRHELPSHGRTVPYTISGVPRAGAIRAATARTGSDVEGRGSIGNRDQMLTHRSPGPLARSAPDVDALRYSGPGPTSSWVSVNTHTSASTAWICPATNFRRRRAEGTGRATFHVATLMPLNTPSRDRFSWPTATGLRSGRRTRCMTGYDAAPTRSRQEV